MKKIISLKLVFLALQKSLINVSNLSPRYII